MSLLSRFFGNADASEGGRQLIANAKIQNPLSLQVLFPGATHLDPERFGAALRSYHRSMSEADCEINPELNAEGNVFGLIGWGNHVIRCVGFDLPMPAAAVESCVAPSHYGQDLKERARAHKAHIIFYYAGYDPSPYEQYVALAAAAGSLAWLRGIVVLNESACTSFPLAALSASDPKLDMIDQLRSLPLAVLYCGFVKHEVEGVSGVWMRTYGARLLGLPDFAAHASGHEEGQRYFNLFENIFRYLQGSGAKLAPGHTMQIGDKEYLRCRKPNAAERFLSGDPLVVEVIRADQVTRKI